MLGDEAAAQVADAAIEVTDKALNEDFPVEYDEWIVVKTFQRLINLMRYGAMGGIISLDWSAVTAKLKLLESIGEIEINLWLIEGLEIMEKHFIGGMNDHYNRKNKSSNTKKPSRKHR
jgi:hypothetical protein